MDDKKKRLTELIAQREVLELEADAIASELTSKGPKGEAPAGIKDPVVDNEGFPRGDIDVYRVMANRQRLSVINTDHKKIMKEIESLLPQVMDAKPSYSKNITNAQQSKRSTESKQITHSSTPPIPLVVWTKYLKDRQPQKLEFKKMIYY
eukprot:CAMPEP_0182430182 /NCGR_PEP_ID=MMETSP1167-20130531/38028_1 /TAXON_ID=2988 /ORGANISM="Mallomonas Sp, Strain CCMP3275" /LENGTH=149 /DNA_ID=CAMNT_0024614979 /DNA_START=64 /DNA_END=514 /DNA_ORIENTATION=+